MGEATYYLKVQIPGLNEAIIEEIREFCAEGYRASEFWHGRREDDGPEDFWPDFKKKFPLVSEYLGELLDTKDNNSLAGELDFGLLENTLWSDGDWLYGSAYVWHFANWDRLIAFLHTKWGATTGGWLSDEYEQPDWFAMIETKDL